jgi:RsiW-degrading membrane proteinase PrsW (M82 family)
MKTILSRLIADSTLNRASGKIGLAAIMLACFVFSTFASYKWVTGHPVVMLVGMMVGFAIYIPTMVALWFFDRRNHESFSLVLMFLITVICVFAPLAGAANDFLGRHLPLFVFVGLTEELAKVLPLILLVIFVPRVINGTRDGLIYGALGGLGFAIVEFGYYVAYLGFDEFGWTAVINQIGRANLLGTHNHILWSAAFGAAIGWSAKSGRGWKRVAVPILAYLGVALTHSLEDAGGNVASAMLGGVLLEPILMSFPDPEATMQANMTFVLILFGTVNVLLINIFILPILFVVLRRSGETERKVIREQLASEDRAVVRPDELLAAQADRWLRSRSIPDAPGHAGRAVVQLQNQLAFHKHWIISRRGNVDADPAVMALRALLSRRAF